MNDPGLHEPIATHAKQVENKHDELDLDIVTDELEEKSYLMPTRWWYASTAFPLMAGTFGPMANTFSVCALVQYWRVEIPPGGTEGHGIDIKDPKWFVNEEQVHLQFTLIDHLVGSLLSMPCPSFLPSRPTSPSYLIWLGVFPSP